MDRIGRLGVFRWNRRPLRVKVLSTLLYYSGLSYRVVAKVLTIVVQRFSAKCSKAGCKPLLIKALSEGATSQSLDDVYMPAAESVVVRYNGLCIGMLNIGKDLHRVIAEKDPQEYQLRMGKLIKMTEEQHRGPLFVSTNVCRVGDRVSVDNSVFDDKWLENMYILALTAYSRALGEELSNLGRGSLYAVSTPFSYSNVSDLKEHMRSDICFMVSSKLGTARLAPTIEEVKNVDKVGIMVLGSHPSTLVSLKDSLERHFTPLYVFQLTPRRSLFSRFSQLFGRKREEWSDESKQFIGFFIRKMTAEEFKEAVEGMKQCLEAEPKESQPPSNQELLSTQEVIG